MKKINTRRRNLRHVVCPECREPVHMLPPHRWVSVNGPRPQWSHLDGEPLCVVFAPEGSRPARPHRVPAPPVRRWRHRIAFPPTAAVPDVVAVPDAAPVYVVAGGDIVAVFDTAEAADIMFTTLAGANLEPEAGRLTPALWDLVRASLARQPGIKIIDTRDQPTSGTPPR